MCSSVEFHSFLIFQLHPFLLSRLERSGPIFTKGLSQGLGLKLRFLSQVSAQKLFKIFVLGLVVFTKNLRPVLGLAKGSTLRLVGSGLKVCKEDLNMAAINFSPLQNLKWL